MTAFQFLADTIDLKLRLTSHAFDASKDTLAIAITEHGPMQVLEFQKLIPMSLHPSIVLHIAKFQRNNFLSVPERAVFELINKPPRGWIWIAVHGTLRTMRRKQFYPLTKNRKAT